MPDHLNLIMFGNSDETDLLRAVGDFKQVSGYWFAKYHPGIRWQKSFYDRVLRAKEVHVLIAYVLENPVRRGLVDDWRKYRFTGAVGFDLEDFLSDHVNAG